MNRSMKSVASIVARITGWGMVYYLSLKKAWVFFCLVFVLAPLPLMIVDEEDPSNKVWIMISVFLTQFVISSCFMLLYASGSKVFPALFVGTYFGVSNIVS